MPCVLHHARGMPHDPDSCAMHDYCLLAVIKVRMQVQGEAAARGGARVGMLEMGRKVVHAEGVSGLSKGLSASFLRQAVYSRYRSHGVMVHWDARCPAPLGHTLRWFMSVVGQRSIRRLRHAEARVGRGPRGRKRASAVAEGRVRLASRGVRRGDRQPRRRGDGADAGRRQVAARAASEVQERVRRARADLEERRSAGALARLLTNSRAGDGRHGIAVRRVRPHQARDAPRRPCRRRADAPARRHPRRVRGVVHLDADRHRQDADDEHAAWRVLRRRRLCRSYHAEGGSVGAVQRLRADRRATSNPS